MDSGAKRTFGDVLKLRGETDVNRLAAIVRIVSFYESRQTFRIPLVPPTAQELLGVLARHPGVRSANVQVRPTTSNTRFASGPAGACYYLFSLVDPADAEISSRGGDGHGTQARGPDPCAAAAVHEPDAGSELHAFLHPGALAIKAFNFWRRGDSVRHLVWRPGGGSAEKFPVIDDLHLGHSNGSVA
jgi:hypothetical protein